MKKIRMSYLIILALLFSAFQSYAQENEEPVTWDTNWSKGYQVKSSDGNFKMKFGGRIMLDFLSISPDSYYDTIVTFTRGVEFRRLRFFNSGTIYKNVSYKLQLDFAAGKVNLKDAYINIKKVPVVGNLKIGHFKEPVGLELLTSSKYVTFMERALTNPLTPERNTGIMAYNTALNKRLTWALGYFLPANASGFGLYSGNKYNVSGRIAGTPIYKVKDGFQILHLGLSLTHQNQDNSAYKLTSRPETHLAPKVVLAEIDAAKAVNQFGLETAYAIGSVHLQGEYIASTAQTSPESSHQKDSYNFNAYYGEIGWFITGENESYKSSAGAFSRVSPKNNFGDDGGIGAFEVALRYSHIDLDDTDITGGTMSDITLGLNWYLNPSTRFMANYIFTDVKDQGKLKSFQVRFQIDF
jgi:phosphate-selective porin OprO and OprP